MVCRNHCHKSIIFHNIIISYDWRWVGLGWSSAPPTFLYKPDLAGCGFALAIILKYVTKCSDLHHVNFNLSLLSVQTDKTEGGFYWRL